MVEVAVDELTHSHFPQSAVKTCSIVVVISIAMRLCIQVVLVTDGITVERLDVEEFQA